MNTAQLRARAEELTEQLRKIDEAGDTAAGDREPEPDDLPFSLESGGRGNDGAIIVRVGGAWYPISEAVELTRAALHEIDLALEAKGVL